VGHVKWWAGSFAVTGEVVVKTSYLACNGALVDRSTYAKLFTKIGFAYSPTPGADPGSNKFYLPDFTDGRTFVPMGPTTFVTRGTKAGAKTVAVASDASQDPAHTHLVDNHNGYNPLGTTSPLENSQEAGIAYSGPDLSNYTYWGPGNGQSTGGHSTRTTGAVSGRSAGNPTAHQNMPPVRVVGGMIILFQ
jgi:microcystin-dependent protein